MAGKRTPIIPMEELALRIQFSEFLGPETVMPYLEPLWMFLEPP